MRTRTKILATTAVLGVIGVLIAIGTSAFFSDSATSDVSVAATGTLDFTGGNNIYFTSPNLKPEIGLDEARTAGSAATGTITLENNGTGPITLRLVQTGVGGSILLGGATGQTGTGLVNNATGLGSPGTSPSLFKKLKVCISVVTSPPTPGDCAIYNKLDFDFAPASPDGTGDIADSTSIALGSLPASDGTAGSGPDRRQYTVEVFMPEEANVTDNDYQNQKAVATFRVDAS
jgi:predicted ribosomally synthesized peptide with SipW-like signal peptide